MLDILRWIVTAAIWLAFFVWIFWASFRYDWNFLQQRVFITAVGIIVIAVSVLILKG
ncbi:MAG TPA: hypothetical protein VKB71_16625 [Rhizomicrobium sp.]|nr:hypothetical protein [Rhizomicrobium sp.]